MSAPAREEVLEGLRALRTRLYERMIAEHELEPLDCAIAYLEGLKPPEHYREEAAGQVLAFVDMARTLQPPAHLSAVQALRVYADFAEGAGRGFFGTEIWDAIRRETAPAANNQGIERPAPLPADGGPS